MQSEMKSPWADGAAKEALEAIAGADDAPAGADGYDPEDDAQARYRLAVEISEIVNRRVEELCVARGVPAGFLSRTVLQSLAMVGGGVIGTAYAQAATTDRRLGSLIAGYDAVALGHDTVIQAMHYMTNNGCPVEPEVAAAVEQVRATYNALGKAAEDHSQRGSK